MCALATDGEYKGMCRETDGEYRGVGLTKDRDYRGVDLATMESIEVLV